MSLFSERFRYYVQRTEKTIYSLAKKANVNRPMIHKAMKGDSVPSDGFIRQLAEALMLSSEELTELLDLAERVRVGEVVYWRRWMAAKVLQEINKSKGEMVFQPQKDYAGLSDHTGQQCHVLNEAYAIRCCVWEMIENVKVQNAPCEICFHLPENADELLTMLRDQLVEKKDKLSLLQLVDLEKDFHNDDAPIHNLSQVFHCIGFAFQYGSAYAVRYHYRDYPESRNSSGMPWFIKSPYGTLCLNADLIHGIFYPDGLFNDYMDQYIGKYKNGALPLMMSGEGSDLDLNQEKITKIVTRLFDDEAGKEQTSDQIIAMYTRIFCEQKDQPEILLNDPSDLSHYPGRIYEMLNVDKNVSLSITPLMRSRLGHMEILITESGKIGMVDAHYDRFVLLTEPNVVESIEEYIDAMVERCGGKDERIVST